MVFALELEKRLLEMTSWYIWKLVFIRSIINNISEFIFNSSMELYNDYIDYIGAL